MPELPEEMMHRLQQVGLNPRDANFLLSVDAGRLVGYDGTVGDSVVAFFDAVSEGRDAKLVFNW